MSSRPWSPPLDAHTRTTTTLSVVRARPEHLKAIHAIQLLAYPGRTDFHETEDVFRSKLEVYPAGNFVALATYSVVTDDDVSTWDKSPQLDEGVSQQEQVHDDDFSEEEEDQEHGKKQKREEDGDLAPSIRGVSVIDITETAPDGTTTTATATTTADIPILRARTPDISEEGVDSDGDKTGLYKRSRLPAHNSSTRNAEESETQERHEDQDGDDMTTILFQWEQPVGYLISHPYSRESVTLHRISPAKDSRPAPPSEKKIRLDEDVDESGTDTETDSDDDIYNHDPLMERYYIHDCAVHPDWRGRGLASKLWKALHESLTPHLDNGPSSADKDLVDTEEEDEDEDVRGNTEGEHRQKPHHPHHHRHGHRHRNRGVHRRRGARSLKEIVLVSVQGTRPFWEQAGGFQVVADHDMDLSVYGGDAFFMSAPFRL
ncbi:hypothetical protein KVV02_001917 [Mortierella alpina]|uniref:N-acetyltransferase domain-containing protein n=1 Tax=Mortierella alpina TaxID=64518 RepID=A0A9P8ACR5_MORAP|nr:hypothetical protein KVV02_001917 [Mortierella alpina]